mmetsp:Transcript_13118/g.28337  ORF Transcript_13118/g.28337 Transcript_13118/m.28337 type:complete len:108 (+) Transcript_13118:1771-2094(+)
MATVGERIHKMPVEYTQRCNDRLAAAQNETAGPNSEKKRQDDLFEHYGSYKSDNRRENRRQAEMSASKSQCIRKQRLLWPSVWLSCNMGCFETCAVLRIQINPMLVF